jgi:DNA ligase D-like protein (predicted 3'-phosphoesterase)
MTLESYKHKRRFDKTPEPKPKIKKTGLARFIVQEHYATQLHWDFRLEIDGVLKSWAVPKGIPEKPGIKRLAVQVEDHPVDYIDFEGEIPKGEYGAGIVKIWDKGKFELYNRTDKIIDFKLEGTKLKGNYVMIHTRSSQWIIFKKK